jgi:hypothetical protein
MVNGFTNVKSLNGFATTDRPGSSYRCSIASLVPIARIGIGRVANE